MKTCKDCKGEFPEDQFYVAYVNKKGKVSRRGDCKRCTRIKNDAWNEANAERYEYTRRSYQLRKYGITPEQYDGMFEAQGGKCALCDTDEPGGNSWRFNVDHDHRTGVVRKLLCNSCNLRLGSVENVEWMSRALTYLESA